MLNRNRGNRSAFLRGDFFAVSVLLAYLLVSALAFHSGKQSERRTYEPHQHAVSAAEGAHQACLGREGGAFSECVIEQIAAAEETSRSEQDLQAQQQMALWALLMVIVSAATLGATVWALFYVKGTLEETKKMTVDTKRMADEARNATRAASKAAGESVIASNAMLVANALAREANEKQLRAYVGTEDHTAFSFVPHSFSGHFCKVYNRGQTPAYDVRIWSFPKAILTHQSSPHEAKIFQVGEMERSTAVIGPGQYIVHVNKTDAPLSQESYWAVSAGGMAIVWAGVVSYRDAFGKRHRSTFKYFTRGDGAELPESFDLHACSKGNVAD